MVQIDGTEHDKTDIRLCLELKNGRNLYFRGELAENGECTIKVPKLMDIESQGGRAVIEAIADGSYFKLYEADLDLRNSVEIKIESKLSETAPSIKLNMVDGEEKKPVVAEKKEQPKTEPKQESSRPGFRSFKDYRKSLT